MKTSAIRSLRQKLAADETVFGLWVTLESPSITEMAVALNAPARQLSEKIPTPLRSTENYNP